MPQFDKLTFFNQIFWFLLIFVSFYLIVLKALLPALAISLKTRKKFINYITYAGSSSASIGTKRSYFKGLQSFFKSYKSLFSVLTNSKISFLQSSKAKIITKDFI